MMGDVVRIIFDLPDAAPPPESGIGDDQTLLGLRMQSIVLDEVAEKTNQ